MKIKIQKEKAIKREKIQRLSWLIIGTLIWFLILNGIFNVFQFLSFNDAFGWKLSYLIYSLIFMSAWEYVYYRFFLLKINSLKYSIEEKGSRLLSSRKIILKQRDTAKLQVINSVDITQDIWDKFVDLYSVEICYGFSEGGYKYYFHYLSEKEAERILEIIKPVSKTGVEIK